ncbi:MAG: hypothetical protein KAY59_05265, partial [Acidobacteria bacterium]|nr:hypothetical protein [Acidobacteriota bacterium]
MIPLVRSEVVRRWGRRVLGALLAVAAGLAVTVFSIDLGPGLKGFAEREASQAINRPVHIGKISALVGRGEFEISDVMVESLKPTDVPFLRVQRVRVSVPWWTVFRRALVIDRVRVTGLNVSIETWPNDFNNIPKPKPRAPGRPLPFTTTLGQLSIDDSEFSYQDNDTHWSIVCRNLSMVVVRALNSYYGKAGFNNGTLRVQTYLPMQAAMNAGFRIEDGQIRINRAQLTTDGAESELAGVADLRHWPEQNYVLKSKVLWPEMRRIFFDGSHFELSGNGSFDGTFHKYKGGYDVQGRFASPVFGVLTSFGTYRFPNIAGNVVWTPKRLDVTDMRSEFHGGRAVQAYSLAPLGQPTPPTARWDVAYENVDLTDFSSGLEWPVLRLAGRATGRNVMTWTNGQFGATKVGDGEISSIAPDNAALTAPELPARLEPVPAETPWDVHKRLSPYKVAGNIKYTWAPTYMDVAEGSWASTPNTYLAFHGRTEYGDNSQVPFHLTSTDWQESDRLLVEVLGAFKSTSTPIMVGGFGTFDGVLTKAFWNPHIEGTFAGDHLRYWDVDWGRARGRAVIENAYADVTDATFDRHGGTIVANGRYSLGYPRADKGQEIDARVTIT